MPSNGHLSAKLCSRPTWVFLLLVLASFGWAKPSAQAAVPIVEPGNTNLAVLVTGGVTPLISRVLTIDIATNAPGGVVELDLGFATQEANLGGTLADSMTVTLLDAAERAGAIVLVMDASGVVWAPVFPGAIPLPHGEPVATSIDRPEIRMGLPGLNAQFAYHVAVRIPSALWGPQVKLALDVFDFPNGLTSVAWSGPPSFTPDIIPPCAPPPTGLIAWWRGEDDVRDSASVHHGHLGSGADFASGRVGRAFHFDGTDLSFVTVTSDRTLSPQAGLYPPTSVLGGELSVEAWIRPSSLPSVAEGWRTTVAKDGEYALEIGTTGRVRFTVVDLDGTTASAEGGTVTPGDWQHVAGTFRQGQFLRIYVGGRREGSLEFPLTVGEATSAPLLLGRGNPASPDGLFRGEIDEVSLYYHALSDADIAAVQAAGLSGKCNAPLSLRFQRVGSRLQLRWLQAAGGVVLEQADALGVGANWLPSNAGSTLAGDDRVAEVSAESTATFYRLRR